MSGFPRLQAGPTRASGQERTVIVVGDVNDEPLAATSQILLGPPGSELETAGFNQPDKGDGMRLWYLAPRVIKDHPERAFTPRFRGRSELRAAVPTGRGWMIRLPWVPSTPRAQCSGSASPAAWACSPF